MTATIEPSVIYSGRWLVTIDGFILQENGDVNHLTELDTYTRETKSKAIALLDKYYYATYTKTVKETDYLEVSRK